MWVYTTYVDPIVFVSSPDYFEISFNDRKGHLYLYQPNNQENSERLVVTHLSKEKLALGSERDSCAYLWKRDALGLEPFSFEHKATLPERTRKFDLSEEEVKLMKHLLDNGGIEGLREILRTAKRQLEKKKREETIGRSFLQRQVKTLKRIVEAVDNARHFL